MQYYWGAVTKKAATFWAEATSPLEQKCNTAAFRLAAYSRNALSVPQKPR